LKTCPNHHHHHHHRLSNIANPPTYTALVDDVIFGCVSQIGAQAANVARNVVLSSKLPMTVPGTSVDRQCGSSQQAIHFAAQAVMSGTQDIVIAGGVESMSQVSHPKPIWRLFFIIFFSSFKMIYDCTILKNDLIKNEMIVYQQQHHTHTHTHTHTDSYFLQHWKQSGSS
jgi:hypothetical protein